MTKENEDFLKSQMVYAGHVSLVPDVIKQIKESSAETTSWKPETTDHFEDGSKATYTLDFSRGQELIFFNGHKAALTSPPLKHIMVGEVSTADLEVMLQSRPVHLAGQQSIEDYQAQLKAYNDTITADLAVLQKKHQTMFVQMMARYNPEVSMEIPEKLQEKIVLARAMHNPERFFPSWENTHKDIAANLLRGHPAHLSRFKKDNTRYQVWEQVNFLEKDKHGNLELFTWHEGYGFNPKEEFRKYNFPNITDETLNVIVAFWEKGHKVRISAADDAPFPKVDVYPDFNNKSFKIFNEEGVPQYTELYKKPEFRRKASEGENNIKKSVVDLTGGATAGDDEEQGLKKKNSRQRVKPEDEPKNKKGNSIK